MYLWHKSRTGGAKISFLWAFAMFEGFQSFIQASLIRHIELEKVIWKDFPGGPVVKNLPCIIGDWNAKVVSQETPGVTGKFGLGIRNEAGQRLIEFCQENALVITNTLFQQQKRRYYIYMDVTRWSTPNSDWLYSLQPKMEKLYTVSKNKTRSWLWLRPWTPYCQIQT